MYDPYDLLEGWYCSSVNTGKSLPSWETWIENNKLVIQVLVAGYSKDKISIETTNDKITISSPKVEVRGKTLVSCLGFNLPLEEKSGNWDFPKAQAGCKDGVLTIEVPAKENARGTKIPIE